MASDLLGGNGMKLVILGFGYSSRAFAADYKRRCASLVVTARSEDKIARLQREGWDALAFRGGEALSEPLRQVLEEATDLLISIPPDEQGDPVLMALASGGIAMPNVRRVIYLSTVGVYGDHGGGWVDEESALNPGSARARYRVDAEKAWTVNAQNSGYDLGIFRLSGIYGPGRSAIDNLKAGTARRIIKPGQVFNRIHVEDIAGAIGSAFSQVRPLGVFNLTDSEPAPPQDVVAYGAGLLGLPVPPDIPFERAPLSEMGRSFYAENKRVSNSLIQKTLAYAFRYPSYREGLAACLKADDHAAS